MKKPQQAIPQQPLTPSLAALDMSTLLGGIIPAEQAVKQLANPKLRAKAQKKEKKVRRDFAPPVSHPPRGPDLQISATEQSLVSRLREEIAYFRTARNTAQHTEHYKTQFFANILGA